MIGIFTSALFMFFYCIWIIWLEHRDTSKKINSLIQEIKQEPVSNNERNYALKKLLELKEKL